jgi:hypothetical protein
MTQYINDLLSQRDARHDRGLTGELEEALNEALIGGRVLSKAELLAWHCLTVAHCNGLSEVLDKQPESVPITAKFARERGLLQTASALDNVAKGIGATGPTFSTGYMGDKTVHELIDPYGWGEVDIFLSLVDEDLYAAIFDFVTENAEEFTATKPASVRQEVKRKNKISKHKANKTAVQLLHEVIAHKSPTLRCELHENGEKNGRKKILNVPVLHEAEPAMSSRRLAKLKEKYGAAATALFEMYAAYDGVALFVVNGEAAFHLVPSAYWAGHMAHVMAWAEDVTWQEDPEEIPAYLKSAIPFGYMPGDSERWLLITEGEFAGMVMLSDTDVCEEEPRFSSMAEFMSTLIVDAERIVGVGGYVMYGGPSRGGRSGDGSYYPVKYLFTPN